MTKPENSSIRRSKVGEQRKPPKDSRYERGTTGGQVKKKDTGSGGIVLKPAPARELSY